MIQIFSNSLGEEELQAVKKVFESKWLGRGPECKALEEELCTHFGVSKALLFNCCTSAIYTALKVFGVGPGDEVIISTANFVATASAVIDLGAKPVFADVDPHTFNILPSEIERLKNARTKAVIILHYGGHPAAFDEIRAACGDKIRILEDSANSVSSVYKGTHCGALGDAGVFSFDAMKTLVMGDGGVLLMKEEALLKHAEALRYLGYGSATTSGQTALKSGQARWWEYDLECTSGRFISNDILAAIGRIQLRKLPGYIKRRREIWDYYQKSLAGIEGLILPPEPLKETSSSYYLYWVKAPGKRDELAHFMKERNVYCTFRYFPLHLVKHFHAGVNLPNAEEMNENALNIPLHQNLTDLEAEQIVGGIKDFFNQ